MSYIAFDFECPNCGTFDALIPRSESAGTSSTACPSCHADSGRVLSPVRSMTVWGYAATRGKYEPPPHEGILHTRSLGEGTETHTEFKARRRKYRLEESLRENKKLV